jgi:uncharacterized membrane protein HdeD (DUF308 family)
MIPWWLLAMQGGSAVLLGVLLLPSSSSGEEALAAALGLYWLVAGVLALVRAFMDHGAWAVKLLTAALGVLAAASVVVSTGSAGPLWGLGLLGVGIGSAHLAEAFYEGSYALRALGMLSVLLGMLAAFSPLGPWAALPTAAGVLALGVGVVAVVSSVSSR